MPRSHLGLGARVLVGLSNIVSRWRPANFARYADDLAYSQFQMRNAEATYRNLYEPVQDFNGKVILDAGCGEGGKTVYYASKKPRLIIGIDCYQIKVDRAKGFCSYMGMQDRCHFLTADAEKSPFPSNFFDIVLSEDCFEHYPKPEAVLWEARRILRPGGLLLVTFNTYYNLGGPHLYNFIRFPWPHLLFSDATMIDATRAIARQMAEKHSGQSGRESYKEQAEREIYQFQHYVNRITLAQWRKFIARYEGMEVLVAKTRFGRNPIFRLPVIEELRNDIFYVISKR